ncbi:MAG TPA: hypothetical protein VND45_02975, partial [Thermoanaerobaculia bacterium]|nr:hypothetical protein [Thermoanaerobaculia bacterium]
MSLTAVLLAATINWQPFELPAAAPEQLQAQMGRLTVPLRRDRPNAGAVELAFVRLRAGGTGAPIVYLAGGPGGSGIGAARNPYALPSLTKLARQADLIL